MPRLRANQPVGAALRELIAKHTHLALIEDDQRRIVGMLTLEDIFEELVGDIEDELDRLPRYLTPSGRQWVVGGGIPLGRLRVALDRPELGAKFSSETTVSAWLEDALDHAPKGGDPVCLDGIHALIRKVRRKRVVEAVLDPSGPIVVPSA